MVNRFESLSRNRLNRFGSRPRVVIDEIQDREPLAATRGLNVVSRLPLLFLVAGLGLSIWGFQAVRVQAAAERLKTAIRQTPAVLEVRLPSGPSRPIVSAVLENRSDRTIRIIGASKTCRLESCVLAEVDTLPIAIPPQSTRIFRFRLLSKGKSSFVNELQAFTDNESQPEFFVKVSGVVEPSTVQPSTF